MTGRHTRAGGEFRDDRRLPLWIRMSAIGVVSVIFVGAGALLAPAGTFPSLPWTQDPPCRPEPVTVLVEPELHDTVRAAVLDLDRAPVAGGCLRVDVVPRDGALVAGSSQVLPPDRAPQLWIPDSPRWTGGVTRWKTQQVGTLAMTPVVVATSRAAAKSFGWLGTRPTWDQLLSGTRPMAAPDIAERADSLAGLVALWQTLGSGPAADAAIVNVVLNATRGQVASAEEALTISRSGTVNAPTALVTEQAVAATNASVDSPALAAIYPKEGSPFLSYPVLRVSAAAESQARQTAVRIVLSRLLSGRTVAIARRNGFRGPHNEPPAGIGIDLRPMSPMAPPPAAQVAAITDRLRQLERPSRILAVIDVSTSMRATLDDGVRRLDLAAGSAGVGMGLLPDSAAVGVWVFARNLIGAQDWQEVVPLRKLGQTDAGGRAQRDVLASVVTGIDGRVHGGGTGLYDTVLAAFRRMHQTFDAGSNNAIIMLTDGGDDDKGGTTLEQLVGEIRRLNAGPHKVEIYLAGLGPDANYPAMERITATAGGRTYRIDSALQAQSALLDGFRNSR